MTKVRSIRVFSAAKVNALLYGILGLLLAPFLLLGPGLAMLGADGSKRTGFGGVIFFAAILPICYAVIGFISGALMAFIYNAISHAIGGLEVELEFPPPVIVNALQVSLSGAAPVPASDLPPPPRPEFE
jgi:hypothetical protein